MQNQIAVSSLKICGKQTSRQPERPKNTLLLLLLLFKSSFVLGQGCGDCPSSFHRNGCFLPWSTGSCVPCPDGTYKSWTGNQPCSFCPEDCQEGFYRDACGDSSAGACVPCSSSCPTGQFHSECGGLKAGTCLFCPVCATGQFRSACTGSSSGSCTACDACGVGKYRSGCGGTSTGTCESCGSCASGKYRSGCNFTSAGTCAVCDDDCGIGNYRSGCSGLAPGNCAPCGSCTSGTYRQGCSGTSAGTCVSCASCPAGTYRAGCGDSSPGTCVGCPTGSYKLVNGSGECTDCDGCPAGKFRDGCGSSSAGSCSECPEKTFKESDGPEACLVCASCPSGFERSGCGLADPGTCQRCRAQYFKLSVGRDSCTLCESCPAGHDRQGCGNSSAGTCEVCGINTFKASGGRQACGSCDSCPAGTYRTGCGGSAPGTCVDCPVGSYKPFSGTDECVSCGSCPVGRFRDGCGISSAGSCIECAENTFKDSNGSHTCMECTLCAADEDEAMPCSSQRNRMCTFCSQGQCCSRELTMYRKLDGALEEAHGGKMLSVSQWTAHLPETKKLCHEQPELLADRGDAKADYRLLYAHCSDICSEKDVSIMAGAGWMGVNLEVTLEICLNTADVLTPVQEEFCASDVVSLCNIEIPSKDVVTTLTTLSYATLAKKSSMADLVSAARIEALDNENMQIIADRVGREKSTIILQIYSRILEKFSNSEDDYSRYLLAVGTSFQDLKNAFDSHIDDIMLSLLLCTRMVPRTNQNNSVIFNMCSQDQSACIERSGSSHVSCSCLYNPSAEVPGLHTSQTLDLQSCTFYDTCSDHRIDSSTWIRDFHGKIDAAEYELFETSLVRSYGESFSSFDIILKDAQAPIDKRAAQPFPFKLVTSCNADGEKKIRDVEDRLLPESLRAEGNRYRHLEIVYDFKGEVTDNFCEDVHGATNSPLFDRCEEFCGFGSVPLLLGSQTGGVTIDQALAVCFDQDVVGPSDDQRFCAGPGRLALERLQNAMADLTSNITLFRTLQVLSADVMQTTSNRMREDAQAAAELETQLQETDYEWQKIAVYKDFYSQQLARMYNQRDVLLGRGEELKRAFKLLNASFDKYLPDLQRFSANCSQGFPRTTNNQAILAVCPVSGSVCAHSEVANYVYCCCSSNTLLTSDFAPIDVCSEAKNSSAAPYKEAITSALDVDTMHPTSLEGSYYAHFLDGMAIKYGEDFDPPPPALEYIAQDRDRQEVFSIEVHMSLTGVTMAGFLGGVDVFKRHISLRIKDRDKRDVTIAQLKETNRRNSMRGMRSLLASTLQVQYVIDGFTSAAEVDVASSLIQSQQEIQAVALGLKQSGKFDNLEEVRIISVSRDDMPLPPPPSTTPPTPPPPPSPSPPTISTPAPALACDNACVTWIAVTVTVLAVGLALFSLRLYVRWKRRRGKRIHPEVPSPSPMPDTAFQGSSANVPASDMDSGVNSRSDFGNET